MTREKLIHSKTGFSVRLIMTMLFALSTGTVLSQTVISSLSQINDNTGHYIITADVNASGYSTITNFSGTLEADIDPTTKMPYRISGLTVPLFGTLTGTVRNLVIEDVTISQSGQVGAIACTADYDARIYNVGILGGSVKSTGTSSDKSATDCCGGLVGSLNGSARVVNCYSYANITGGNRVGGIVGYNNVKTASNNLKTMVFGCMFYGNITGGNDIAPIYNGEIISNKDANGVSNYNYFRLEAPFVQPTGITYNCALGAEDRFLQRFEFYRHLLNGHRELAGWWATGTYSSSQMMKWVLEPSQLDGDKPYPILKVSGKYPSVVNHDAENADEDQPRNEGGKLGTLTVTIQMGSGGAVYGAPEGAGITTSQLTLNITDKDPDHYDFNYYKVQLPYYNDVGTKNYNGNRVVTGWKIVSITGGTPGTYSTGDDVTYTDGVLTATPYNFADRNCTNKDLYSVSGRVFNQGAYWDVPYGVTAITIEPYWAKCTYLADAYADVVYNTAMTSATNVPNVGGGQKYTNRNSYSIAGENQRVFTSKGDAIATSNYGLFQGTSGSGSHTVYDYAVVLVGNYHFYGNLDADMSKPYTVTSIDLDGDNEPDYSYILRFDSRKKVHPVRVDFINIPGLGMAQKSTGGTGSYNFGIMQPNGWFESTNTSLFRVTQFEYDNSSRVAAPYILQGGVMEQWVNGQSGGHANKTTYFHVGGNVWFKEFHRGTHQDAQYDANHSPISVTGGDFDQFHLTGLYRADVTIRDDNAECYITGGRFRVVAGTGMDGIGHPTNHTNGNITWIIDNADIKEFYAGSFNADKPAQGNLHTIVNGGHIDFFCGGPKFGDMNAGRTVTTTATGCTFGTFFGAGYGGNSYSRQAPRNHNNIVNFPHNDNQAGNDASWNAWLARFYKQAYDDTYGGVSTQFNYQFLPMSGNADNVARIFVEYVKFSMATTRNVTSNLTDCTITGNFYGGGNLGKVDGPVTSTLTDCTVHGSVFGAGYSASLPTVEVDSLGFRTEPYYYDALGTYRTAKKGATTTYYWQHKDNVTNTASAIDTQNHILYTTEDLDNLGTVTGNVELNIYGNTLVEGKIIENNVPTSTQAYGVFGGGDASKVDGNTEVNIETATHKNGYDYNIYNVFGGGNSAPVQGNATVTLTNGIIQNDIYGGGNKDDVGGSVTVNITDGTVKHDVYGGGALANTNINNWDTSANNGAGDWASGKTSASDTTRVRITGGTIVGNAYGGGLGRLADTEHGITAAEAMVYGDVLVELNKGVATTEKGASVTNVFGANNINGSPMGKVTVHVYATQYADSATITGKATGVYDVQAVYGGGNEADYTPADTRQSTEVVIEGCEVTRIKDVYGGGNAAAVPATEVWILGTDTIDNVFGGGNGERGPEYAANVGFHRTSTGKTDYTLGDGKANTKLVAGVIHNIYGGSNSNGDLRGGAYITMPQATDYTGYTATTSCCDDLVTDHIYGGGKNADMSGGTNIVLGCMPGDRIDEIYAGAQNADVDGDVSLTITSGIFGRVFGGNKDGGLLKGSITVNIEETGECGTPIVIGELYGGGNLAGYSIYGYYQDAGDGNKWKPRTRAIYDALADDEKAAITPYSDPRLNVHSFTSIGTIYGGGYKALMVANPQVDIDVVKGSQAANAYAEGIMDIALPGTVPADTLHLHYPTHEANAIGTIERVFGGGNLAVVDGSTEVNIGTKSTVEFITGSAGEVASEGAYITGNVYGGGNLANVTGDTHVNIGDRKVNAAVTIKGNVFGAGKGNDADADAALVQGKSNVLMSNGLVEQNIYGGGELSSVNDSATVTVDGLAQVGTVDNCKGSNGKGHVYGSGLGLAGKSGFAYVSNTKVTVGGQAQVHGSVFGSGENGHVHNNTHVTIQDTCVIGTPLIVQVVNGDTLVNEHKEVEGIADSVIYRGNVYGGGRGIDHNHVNYDPDQPYSLTAGRVYGNTNVTIKDDCIIYHDVYGGGSLASVGPEQENDPTKGIAIVTISGGQIGETGENDGQVFGSGRGVAGAIQSQYKDLAYVYRTIVTVSDSADIRGSVFGGGANGHVKTDTEVNIQGGIIGRALTQAETTVAADGTGARIYIGNVYGGGRGVDPYDAEHGYHSHTAGRVFGNTTVNVSGGVIRHAVYGGGSLANVGNPTMVKLGSDEYYSISAWPFDENSNRNGVATVNITGGYIGNLNADGTYVSEEALPGYNNGHVYGAGRGMAADNFGADPEYAQMGYVYSSYVNINQAENKSARIYGSVFGSGENGHVWEDTHVHVIDGTIGSEDIVTLYSGNVYGGGRGVDHPHGSISETAGKVRGNTNVVVDGANVWHSVYGGGSLASIGDANEIPDAQGHYSTGHTSVMVLGDALVRGSVFGAGRGIAGVQYRHSAYNKNTDVLISGSAHIMQNVYGGGNAGHVRMNTIVTVKDTTISGTTYTPAIDGDVFGGGAGDVLSDTAGLVKKDVQVNIRGGRILKSVYGGGEVAIVEGSVDIDVSGGIIGTPDGGGEVYGNIYGGGKGRTDKINAGQIMGNTNVVIRTQETDTIYHNVYGGGAHGTVGDFSYDSTTGMPDGLNSSTSGRTTITITGGNIGTTGKENGMVFGSSRGDVGAPGDIHDKLAWVYETNVVIGTQDSGNGPKIKGSVYGSGENGHTYSDASVTIHSGTIGVVEASDTGYEITDGDSIYFGYEYPYRGNVYGGGCGTDKFDLDNDGITDSYNPLAGVVWGNTTINMDGGHVSHSIYGAGAMGSVGKEDNDTNGKTTINISGGEIGVQTPRDTDGDGFFDLDKDLHSDRYAAYFDSGNGFVYGAARGELGVSTVESNHLAHVRETEVNILSGTNDPVIWGSVFGGGEAGIVKQSVAVKVAGGHIMHDVYGGGALANTNTDNWDASANDGAGDWATDMNGYNDAKLTYTTVYKTTVNLIGGTIGNAYGGALGSTDVEAFVFGDVDVTVDGARFDTLYLPQFIFNGDPIDIPMKSRVFGANNINGTPKGHINVMVYQTVPLEGSTHYHGEYEINSVYGGGNLANYLPATGKETKVLIDGCDDTNIHFVYGGGNSASVPKTDVTINATFEVGFVFGGGNGYDPINPRKTGNTYTWDANPGADVRISPSELGTGIINAYGGLIRWIYGGSNKKGECGTIQQNLQSGDECPLRITNVYGAGKNANVDNVNIVIKCPGENVEYVYGGSLDAQIANDVNLTIIGGIYKNVFGGNDAGGSIGGNITVNIQETDECDPIIIENLYGGGNDAAYPGNGDTDGKITVNIKSATRIENIYGGGKGSKAVVDGNTEVNINMTEGVFSGESTILPDDYLQYVGGNYHNITDISKRDNVYVEVNVQPGDAVGQYFERSGTDPDYNYTKPVESNALSGKQYYKLVPKLISGKIAQGIGTIGNVYGGGDQANVNGNAVVNIGTMDTVLIMKHDNFGRPVNASNETIYLENGEPNPDISDHVIAYDKQPVSGANITGNVFGGGNNADVRDTTEVNVCAVKGDAILDAGNPTGRYEYESVNLHKTRSTNAVTVLGNIYGGGRLGNVGRFTTDTNGKPAALSNNGKGGISRVTIMGYAEIGPDNMQMTASGGPDDKGHVFGASMGTVDPLYKNREMNDGQKQAWIAAADSAELADRLTALNNMAYVYDTYVTIGDSAFVKGSVYGGSENGHVLHNTYVFIQDSCQIGNGDGVNRRYNAIEWTYDGSGDDKKLAECASWPYGAENTYYSYDKFADTPGYDSKGGNTTGDDGHTFYGNVFGGGSGYFPYAPGRWLRSAGLVEGDTHVEITGGHILTSIYGGNEQTDVNGSTTVRMTGGTLGVPRTLAQIAAHPVTCYLFGAGKGDQRVLFNTWTNIESANVEVSGTARIYGSVFGGGEDGHITGDAVVTIGGNALIGTTGTSYVDGNVFGGGRGFSGTALTAGAVSGDITVNITGGTMLGSIYGGGRLASVGIYCEDPDGPNYGNLQEDGSDTHGHITVNISGGVIGNMSINENAPGIEKSGNVFGASMGRLFLQDGSPNDFWPRLAKSKETQVSISGGTVKRNVYGGGEFGSVRDSANISITGGTIQGSVFGGGFGSYDTTKIVTVRENGADVIYKPSLFAGIVEGNTNVDITGDADIQGSVYGGGELASVGVISNVHQLEDKDNSGRYIYRHDFPAKPNDGALYSFGLSWPYEFVYDDVNTGISTVKINGNAVIQGYVFGAGKGKVDIGVDSITEHRFKEALIANVRKSEVIIGTSGDPVISMSVYGGGEDGHVYDTATVTINNGTIAHSIFGGGKGESKYQTKLYDPAFSTIKYKASLDSVHSWTAGKVYGSTIVTMNGGSVGYSIYGGGNLASVGKGNYGGGQDDYSTVGYGELPADDDANLWTTAYKPDDPGTEKDFAWHFLNSGHATVTINGGTVGGDNTTYGDLPTGNVFGSSRGLAAKDVGRLSPRYRYVPDFFLGYVNDAEVIIGNGTGAGPTIRGSVYGGGQDGHVRRNTHVTVNNGTIGVTGSEDRGNVFGAGSGIGRFTEDNINHCNTSSGSVTNTTKVDILGGTINGNVYGGGALASVGPPFAGNMGPTGPYDELKDTIANHKSNSNTLVNIKGGYISGSVYGASRGPSQTLIDEVFTSGNAYDASRFATVIWADVNITGDADIQGSVYGGGEKGIVKHATLVNIGTTGENGQAYTGTIHDNVFGGGKEASVGGNVTVNMNSGTVMRDVYGGGALANTNVNTHETTIGAYGLANINGAQNTVEELTEGLATLVLLNGGIIRDVYGGGLGRIAVTAVPEQGIEGLDSIASLVYGDVTVRLNNDKTIDEKGCIVERVFGCNNLYGTPRGQVHVYVDATQNPGTENIGTKVGKPIDGLHVFVPKDELAYWLAVADANSVSNGQITAARAVYNNPSSSELDCNTQINVLKELFSKKQILNYWIGAADGVVETAERDSALYIYNNSDQDAEYQKQIDALTYSMRRSDYDVTAVYGGGNLAPYMPDSAWAKTADALELARPEVFITGCDVTSIWQVYGGGNAAPVPATHLSIREAYEIEEVFGGGNGADDYQLMNGMTPEWYDNPGANVGYRNYTYPVFVKDTTVATTTYKLYNAVEHEDGDTKEERQANYRYGSGVATTEVTGGRVHTVYGGSNMKGNISTTALSVYEESGFCPLKVDATFGGPKNAEMDAVIETHTSCSAGIEEVFGGAKNSDVNSDIVMNITNGSSLKRVYGGNYTSGNVNGSITVNLKEGGCEPIIISEGLYAGGFLADYSIYGYDEHKKPRTKAWYDALSDHEKEELKAIGIPHKDPTINIISATYIDKVFGGGYHATVIGNPHINVNMEEGRMDIYPATEIIDGVETTYYVAFDKNNTERYQMDEAVTDPVSGKIKYYTKLGLGTIGTIYGGGDEAPIDGDTYVEIGTGQWLNNDLQLEIEGIYDNAGNQDTLTFTYDSTSTKGHWIHVNVHGETTDTIFLADRPTPARSAARITGDVFGGGNNADVTGNTNITIGDSLHPDNPDLLIERNVYGGGNMGSVGTITSYTKNESLTDGFGLSWPYKLEFAANTGKTTINMNGGRVGLSGKDWFGKFKLDEHGDTVYKANSNGVLILDEHGNKQPIHLREDNGDVYGGSKGNAGGLKGEPEPDRYKEALIANVRETEVNINLPDQSDDDIEILASYDWEDEEFKDKMKYALKLEDGLSGIAGSVYGGGEDGHVYDSTHVNIRGGYIGHAVYGGGKGKGTYKKELKKIEENGSGGHDTYETDIQSVIAGKIYGNTNITMTGGHVMRNIYGGGNLGSVGKGNYASGKDDYYPNGYGEKLTGNLWDSVSTNSQAFMGSGKSTVRILDGKVGFMMQDNTPILYTSHTPEGKKEHGAMVSAVEANYSKLPKKISFKDDLPTGNVFGGSRGVSAPDVGKLSPRYEFVPEFYLGYVNETEVIIGSNGNGPVLLGSVYGGGQDGHVRRDAKVEIANGEIGLAFDITNKKLIGADDSTDVQWLHRGNVYGAGSGIGKYEYQLDDDKAFDENVYVTLSGGKILRETNYGSSSGSVSRFTTVSVGNGMDGTPGNVIYHNVYGGGSLSSIGPAKIFQEGDPYLPTDNDSVGKQTLNRVDIAGTVGHADSYAAGYGGNVFGASRGSQAVDANTFATSFYTTVNLNQGANVLGNVFGGGEVGQVKNDTYVNMATFDGAAVSSATIGNDIFGGGDQADVNGNTTVNIAGGHIMHNVYGGGKMGSVGTVTDTIYHNTKPKSSDGALYDFSLSWPVELTYKSGTGDTHVNVTGGRVGTSGDDNGDVFGGGMGNIFIDWAAYGINLDNVNPNNAADIDTVIKVIDLYRYKEQSIANVNNTYVVVNFESPDNLDDNNLAKAEKIWDIDDGEAKAKFLIDAEYAFPKKTDPDTGDLVDDEEQPGHFTSFGETNVITGSVYGGSENGHVIGDTHLTLTDGIVGHALYGGGKGKGEYRGRLYNLKHAVENQSINYVPNPSFTPILNSYIDTIYSLTAGKVYGNTNILMEDGFVIRSVFGGGNLGSVGKGNYSGGTDDYSLIGYGERAENDDSPLWDSTVVTSLAWQFLNSGKCKVEIKGGQIGYILASGSPKNVEKVARKDDLPTGNVFGACRGQVSPNGNVSPRYLYIPNFFLGYANETEVIIGTESESGGPKILGSVYGGGQDGHVRRNTNVTVNHAEIGIPYTDYYRQRLNKNGALESNDITSLHWKGRGNVLGAGSGIGTYNERHPETGVLLKTVTNKDSLNYNYSSGSVTCNTHVTINEGAIVHQNVFGGGSLASIGPPNTGQGFAEFKTTDDYPDIVRDGNHTRASSANAGTVYLSHASTSSTNVIIDGGVIGDEESHAKGYGGNVFGGSRGNYDNSMDLGATPERYATTIWTEVQARNGQILGNVFGGGEAGVVTMDTHVLIGDPDANASGGVSPAPMRQPSPAGGAQQSQQQSTVTPQQAQPAATTGNNATESLRSNSVNYQRR